MSRVRPAGYQKTRYARLKADPERYARYRERMAANRVKRRIKGRLPELAALWAAAADSVSAPTGLVLPAGLTPVEREGERRCPRCERHYPLADFYAPPNYCRGCFTQMYRAKAGPRILIAGTCAEDGKAFVSINHGTRYCSEVCAKRRARRDGRHRRRQRMNAANRDQIPLAAIAKRDGWRCHICHRKVSKATWSLDHLVPLVHGGTHTLDNVALAHHQCNSLRGAHGQAQLRLAA